jgi:hypothetical protein
VACYDTVATPLQPALAVFSYHVVRWSHHVCVHMHPGLRTIKFVEDPPRPVDTPTPLTPDSRSVNPSSSKRSMTFAGEKPRALGLRALPRSLCAARVHRSSGVMHARVKADRIRIVDYGLAFCCFSWIPLVWRRHPQGTASRLARGDDDCGANLPPEEYVHGRAELCEKENTGP